jgi:multicomponent Na+:H+ antiporter subunit B
VRDNPVLRVVTKIVVPAIFLFALYVQFHGDYGPGGGFQAGVIFAAGLILYGLIFGTESIRGLISTRVLRALIAAGLLLFAGVGFLSLVMGSDFLDYDALGQDPLSGQHLGVFLVELGVGITVAAVMVTIFVAFAGRRDN